METKYNRLTSRCDIQVSLAFKDRLLDIKKQRSVLGAQHSYEVILWSIYNFYIKHNPKETKETTFRIIKNESERDEH